MKFTVSGDPVTKDRPRLGAHGRAYTPERTVQGENHVRYAWLRATRTTPRNRVMFPRPTELEMQLDFRCATNRRADIDNLAKLVMDALNGYAYTDDSQIGRLVVDVWRGVGADGACSHITIVERP